jgi:membrane protein
MSATGASEGSAWRRSEFMIALRSAFAVFRRIGERNVGLISAGVAFFAILAIFPGIAAVIALFGFLADPAVIREQMAVLQDFAPPEVYRLLTAQVNALLGATQSTLGWTTLFSTLAALWSARAGVGALQRGLNAIYGGEMRSGFWQIVSALGLTVALVGVVLVALLAVVVAPVVLAYLPLGPLSGLALSVLPWAVALGVMFWGLGLVYRYGPNLGHAAERRAMGRRTAPGVILAVVVWAAASIGFSLYLTNFGTYNQVYGSIGAVIALLMWLYIGAFVVLLGACLNAEMDRLRAHPGSPKTGNDNGLSPDGPPQ